MLKSARPQPKKGGKRVALNIYYGARVLAFCPHPTNEVVWWVGAMKARMQGVLP